MKSKLLRTLFTVVILFLVIGCARKMDPKNRFIAEFLHHNGKRLYKSEIERTKVDFLPHTSTLVYTFWKKPRFDENGKLFLHIYVKDSTKLPINRKKYGFLNLSIGTEDIQHLDSINFYIVKELPDYKGIKKLVTGQYKDKKRSWEVEAVIDTLTSTNQHTNVKLNNKINTVIKKPITSQNREISFIEKFIYANSQFLFEDSVSKISFYLSPNNCMVYINLPRENKLSLTDYNFEFYESNLEGQGNIRKKFLSEGEILNLSEGSKIICINIPPSTSILEVKKINGKGNRELFQHNFD